MTTVGKGKKGHVTTVGKGKKDQVTDDCKDSEIPQAQE